MPRRAPSEELRAVVANLVFAANRGRTRWQGRQVEGIRTGVRRFTCSVPSPEPLLSSTFQGAVVVGRTPAPRQRAPWQSPRTAAAALRGGAGQATSADCRGRLGCQTMRGHPGDGRAIRPSGVGRKGNGDTRIWQRSLSQQRR